MEEENHTKTGAKPKDTTENKDNASETLREVMKFLYDVNTPTTQTDPEFTKQSQSTKTIASTSSTPSCYTLAEAKQFKALYEQYTEDSDDQDIDVLSLPQPTQRKSKEITRKKSRKPLYERQKPPPDQHAMSWMPIPMPSTRKHDRLENICRRAQIQQHNHQIDAFRVALTSNLQSASSSSPCTITSGALSTGPTSTEFDLYKFNQLTPMMMTIQGRTSEERQAQNLQQKLQLQQKQARQLYLQTQQPQPAQVQITQESIGNVERVAKIRQDNLMKLWAVHSIVNDKPDMLVDATGEDGDVEDRPGSEFGDDGGKKKRKTNICMFCMKNGEPMVVYAGHKLKNPKGEVLCPILQKHKCEMCGATGIKAHTLKHCPFNKEAKEGQQLPPFRLLANGTISLSHNHK